MLDLDEARGSEGGLKAFVRREMRGYFCLASNRGFTAEAIHN
jgi:hypothetical protein